MDGIFRGEMNFEEQHFVPAYSAAPMAARFKDDESPLTDSGGGHAGGGAGTDSYSEEELFHLEMSDEGGNGSGKKRSKMDESYFKSLACAAQFMPQKRGANQPLGMSASDVTSKKARKSEAKPVASTNIDECKQKWICPQQAMEEEEISTEDDDPLMAKAAVYYLLVLEDHLVSKNFYEGKNKIHPKSISINVEHRRKLLDWLFRVNSQFAFHFDTWVLTASILDRFLSAQPIEKDVFQLAGCAAFLIAAKHEERFPPKISELVDICARCYNKIDFLKMEQIMLVVLEWNILTPTVNVLIREVALIQNVKDFNPHFVTNMIKKIIFHKTMAYLPPSKVAFSFVSLADPNAQPDDVDKTFKYLLYVLKQDPDEYDDDFTY